jgi:hypothetical protein
LIEATLTFAIGVQRNRHDQVSTAEGLSLLSVVDQLSQAATHMPFALQLQNRSA